MSPIEAIIQRHTDSVIRGEVSAPQGPCPRCLEQPGVFKEHDCRVRSFRFIVESFVHIVESLLLRYKCQICNQTFTVYPSFALPHKRYVLMDIERLSDEYLQNDDNSYEDVVLDQDKMPIGYEKDERYFVRSTPWRWIGYLGSMSTTLNQSLHLIRQKDPNTSIFREVFAVVPRKYRSLRRKKLLQHARRLLRAATEFHRLFGHKVSPRFETACLWN